MAEAAEKQNPIISEQPKQNRKTGIYRKWNDQENEVYAKFLEQNQEHFETPFKRRSQRVFKKLSDRLKTKDISQCKSHHQEMLKKNGTIQKIIEKINSKRGIKKKEDPKSEAKKDKGPPHPASTQPQKSQNIDFPFDQGQYSIQLQSLDFSPTLSWNNNFSIGQIADHLDLQF